MENGSSQLIRRFKILELTDGMITVSQGGFYLLLGFVSVIFFGLGWAFRVCQQGWQDEKKSQKEKEVAK